MDCNREEALRAKQLAEKKMEIKDFYGALKIAMKARARQLYSELENISQMIAVCEVHCSADIDQYINVTGVRPGNFHYTHQRETTGVGADRSTFWTACTFCRVRYQFYREDVLNKVIRCQTCKKSFTAHELNAQGTAAAQPSTTQTQTQTRQPPSCSQENRVPPNRSYTTKPAFEKTEPPKAQGNVNRKRKKRVEESSESSDSSENSESEEEDVETHSKSDENGVAKNVDKNPDNQDSHYFGEQPRRSSRAERNVSYKENHVDIDNDDDVTLLKQAKKSETSEQRVKEDTFWKEEVKKAVKEDKMKESDSKKPQQNDKVHHESKSNDKVEETANDDDSEEEIEPELFECPGSTDAFKVIGEAQRVLLDREKRTIHDSKRRAFGNVSAPKWAPKQPSRPFDIDQYNNVTGVRPGNFHYTHQRETTGVGADRSTFWTACTFCRVRYQFYREDVLNKVIRCQTCKKSFTAHELNAQGTAAAQPSTTQTQTQTRQPPSCSQENRVPPNRSYTTKPAFEKTEPPKAQGNVNRKRKKRIEESSESSDSSENSESEEEDVETHSKSDENGVAKNVDKNPDNQDSQYFGEQPRRSSRAERNVSYKENHVDIDNDDDVTLLKQAKKSETSEQRVKEDTFWKEEVKKAVKEDKMKESDSKKPQQNDKVHHESKSNDKVEETANDDDSEEEIEPELFECPGSTDAFKVIGEAQRVLLDREKRTIHDSKRRAFGNVSAPKWAPKQPSRPFDIDQYINVTGVRPGNFHYTHQRETTGVGADWSTFWTACTFCRVRYQFYREDVLNKVIRCQTCKKSFTAHELNAQGTAAAQPSTTQTQTQTRQPPSYSQENRVPPNRSYTTKPAFEKTEPPKAQGNVNRKRKKRIEVSSESSDSSESSESEEEDVETHSKSDENGVAKNVDKNPDNQDSQYFGEQPRRSSRAERNVPYKENHVDIDNDDDVTLLKQAKKSETSEQRVKEDTFWKEEVKKAVKEDKMKESDSKKPQQNDKVHHVSKSNDKVEETANDDDSEEEIEPELIECPDPEFSEFEKDRKEDSFAVGQIWACYDTEDAMPRLYAYIKKVVSPGFKLQIQLLKPDPVSPDEKKWVLPVSCGRFKRGKSDKAEDLLSFSHLVTWETGQKSGTYNIIPKKGETWALFRNLSIKWHFSTEDGEERKFDYEFVEILSDYDENVGVPVSYLEKVKGFVCLFRRKEGGETIIAGSDTYRFAHMVPSCRMSGTEREGVPKGSYELDPAGLPSSTFEKVNL